MSNKMSRRSENSIIGMRLQLLTAPRKDQVVTDCSPTLKDLREKNPNRVKKFLDVYESKPWCLKSGVNWWLDGILSNVSTPKSTSKFGPSRQIPKRVSVLDDAAKMREIQAMEREHVAQINHSINTINGIVTNSRGFVAMKLRENQFCLNGDLLNIYRLHKIVISPQIFGPASGGGKCIKFIEFLVQLIDDGHFYCYVRHKMLERSMKKILHDHVLTSCIFNQELAQPFKMLDGYQNWITNICNELMKSPTENADDIAVCMEAEKKLMDLIDVVTDAQAVSRITQIQQIPFEIQVKVFSIVRKHEEIQQPMLLLIPKKNKKISYRYPIDVLQLGKFVKSFEFSMTSQELGYKNDSKFFVFERCIIYTTVVNCGTSYGYENHFWMKDVSFGIVAKNKMFAELTNCNHTVQVDNLKMTEILMGLKMKHCNDEITAEIDMSDYELIRLVDSVEDVKKWRRHSINVK